MNLTSIQSFFRRIRVYVLCAVCVMCFSFYMGYIAPSYAPDAVEPVIKDIAAMAEGIQKVGPVTLFLIIFTNNVFKAWIMMLLGAVTVGVVPALFLVVNGYLLGMLVALALHESTFATVLEQLLPHGIIEVPAVLVSAAIGMYLGSQKIHTRRLKRDIVARVREANLIFWYIIMPAFFVAALIEAILIIVLRTT